MKRILRCSLLLSLIAVSAIGEVVASSAAPAVPRADAPRFRWRTANLRLAISNSLFQGSPNIQEGSDVAGAIQRAFDAWRQAADIEFVSERTDRRNVSPAGLSGDGVSLITVAASPENVLLFTRDPFGEAARTRVFYRGSYITEADIVLNPFQLFSTNGTPGTFDLESTLTHEIGHLLGLRHSGVLAATMSESLSKNGYFGFVNIAARSLGASDVAAVRELYGIADEGCCGTLAGRVTMPGTRGGVLVWAELKDSGVVAGQATTSADGSFRIGGLPKGEYSVYWQKTGSSSGGDAGDARIEPGVTTALFERAAARKNLLSLDYIGLNGQLYDSAVGLRAGGEFTVYLGGRGLDDGKTRIFVRSEHISIDTSSLTVHDLRDDIPVISLLIKVSPDAPKGSYSIFASRGDGSQAALVGALDIE